MYHHAMKPYTHFHTLLTLAVGGGVSFTLQRVYPRGQEPPEPIRTLYDTGWAPGPISAL
jgi:hypothetical protein